MPFSTCVSSRSALWGGGQARLRLESIHATSSSKPRPAVLFAFTSLHFTAYINSIIIIIITITTRYDSDENIHGLPPSPVSSSSAQLPYIITCIKGLLEGRKSKGGWMDHRGKPSPREKDSGRKNTFQGRWKKKNGVTLSASLIVSGSMHATSAQRMKVTNHACKTSSSLEE